MSQTLLFHEEVMSLQEPIFEQPQEEPEDWITTLILSKQQDEKLGRKEIQEDDMAIITRDLIYKKPTNRDCISNIYGYYENDNPAIPTAIYYRWCKPPTTAEKLECRANFRARRRAYFYRPAVKVGNSWFPEKYLPDPEESEWSWKEGLELDKHAMSVYQLNEGKVFWDAYKHMRNKGEHLYYRWYDHAKAINDKVPPNPAIHVRRQLNHGEWFDRRWFPSSYFDTRGPKDTVMYHPDYRGSKIRILIDEQNSGSISEQDIFRPPEEEEWIVAHSDMRPEKVEKKKIKTKQVQIDKNPFALSQMKPYRESVEYSTTNATYTPDDKAQWGAMSTEPQSNLKEWQQGFMSREEVSGEQTASGIANPNYRIPKLSGKVGIQSNRLNALAANISPQPKRRRRKLQTQANLIKTRRAASQVNKVEPGRVEVVARSKPSESGVLPTG